jgi:hypothetical protein
MDTIIPESFDDVSDADLDQLEADLIAEFDAKYDSDTPAPVADLTALAEGLDSVRSEKSVRVEAAAQDAEARAALNDRVRPAVEEAPAEEVAPEAEAAEEAPAEEADVVEAELVTASAKPKAPSARRMATREVEVPAVPAASAVVITAAADIPGVPVGAALDRMDLARSFAARSRGLADHSPRVAVASVDTGIPEDHTVKNSGPAASEVIDAVVASYLSGKDAQALVASGGFCSPSQNMYDLFAIESTDGLLDLPSVGITRGGVNVPSFIGLDAVASALWTWTEANDISPGADGTAVKPCLQVPCPVWTDNRLRAEGICITAGNFMDHSYPEMIARTVDLAMTAHAHSVSNSHLADVVASAVAVTVASAPSDAAGDLLSAIDLQVADYRSQYLMGNAVLEAVFPEWVRGAIRSTLAMRAGIDALAVSDAQVTSYFTLRNVRPQFVVGYGPMFVSSPATGWPTTAKFLLYPAGGYVAGDGGSIDLGVVRDSVLNETNDFTAAWSEQFITTVQRGPAAREVTVTTNVDGVTGGPANGGTP